MINLSTVDPSFIDLSLLVPIGPPLQIVGYVITTELYVDKNVTLFENIRKCESELVYPNIIHFGDTNLNKDMYGDALKCVKAGELACIFNRINIILGPLNNAIKGYLNNLPNDWHVILFWN
jgi:hypothetical protein